MPVNRDVTINFTVQIIDELRAVIRNTAEHGTTQQMHDLLTWNNLSATAMPDNILLIERGARQTITMRNASHRMSNAQWATFAIGGVVGPAVTDAEAGETERVYFVQSDILLDDMQRGREVWRRRTLGRHTVIADHVANDWEA